MARSELNQFTLEKAELIATLDQSREIMSGQLEGVALALDLPSQMRSSFQASQWSWLAGALVAGVAAGTLFPTSAKRRENRVAEPRRDKGKSLLSTAGMALARNALTLVAQPALLVPLQQVAEKWLKARLQKD